MVKIDIAYQLKYFEVKLNQSIKKSMSLLIYINKFWVNKIVL
jgi:hypothetical protein